MPVLSSSHNCEPIGGQAVHRARDELGGAGPKISSRNADHMSARTLHRLFQDEPETITESIRHLRLEAIRRDMADPLLSNRGTASIAAHWCMADQSHFSRAFRAYYGISPARARRTQ